MLSKATQPMRGSVYLNNYFGFFLIYTHDAHVLISFPPYFRSHVR